MEGQLDYGCACGEDRASEGARVYVLFIEELLGDYNVQPNTRNRLDVTVYLLRVLIGSFRYLRLLWLAIVIALVMVSRHSTGNHSAISKTVTVKVT